MSTTSSDTPKGRSNIPNPDSPKSPTRDLVLAPGVFMHLGEDQVRFRKGIWSHSQLIIGYKQDSVQLRTCFTSVLHSVKEGRSFDINAVTASHKITEAEKKEMEEILDTLERTGYVSQNSPMVAGNAVIAKLTGASLSPYVGEQVDMSKLKVMVI